MGTQPGKVVLWVVAVVFLVSCAAKDTGRQSGASPAPDLWKQFSSSEHRFTIMFPGDPTITSESQDLGQGISTTTTEYSVETTGDLQGLKFAVAVSELFIPNRGAVQIPVDLVVEGGKQGIRAHGGTITNEQTIVHNEMIGWQFEVTTEEIDSTLQMFFSNWTIYIVEVAREKGKNVDKMRQKFFYSFKIQ